MRSTDLLDLPVAAPLQLDPTGRPVEPLVVVDIDGEPPDAAVMDAAAAAAASSSCVLIGRCHRPPDPRWQPLLDELAFTVVAHSDDAMLLRTCVGAKDIDAEIDQLRARTNEQPMASTALVTLLRISSGLPASDGLVAESLTYSMLLAGPEFASWLAGRTRRPLPATEQNVVEVSRAEDTLTVTLNRPQRHNAYSAQMRDALLDALDVAVWDPSLQRVVLDGAGRSFCSGGDLDEFGTTPDPVTAHVIRVQRSVAARLLRLSDRLEARVHGACIGAGTEFAAFCRSVVAADDAYFQLPEIGMGLVPGAGGTVSVARRVGRWRTAYLALSGRRIDVERALAWDLVDRRADD